MATNYFISLLFRKFIRYPVKLHESSNFPLNK